MQRQIIFILILSISVFGCVSIPDTLTVENRPGNFDLQPTDYLCNPQFVDSPPISAPAGINGFSAPGFSLLSWNIQKENREGWESDLVRLSQNADGLIIQEAFLSEELRRLLNRRSYY